MLRRTVPTLLLMLALIALPGRVFALGELDPIRPIDLPMPLAGEHLEVVINNGFVRTEVTQTFTNPNPAPIEARYSLPLPLSAALSEMTIVTATQTLFGEVLPRDQAEQIYEQQRASGDDAAIATKEGYQRLAFRIAAVPAHSELKMTFVYYQALAIDGGVGRYLYPVEAGGTDPATDAAWGNTHTGPFTAHLTLQSNAPVSTVSLPSNEALGAPTRVSDDRWEATLSSPGPLTRDLVFTYRLKADEAGRVDVLSYRENPAEPGTFMVLLTPGADLRPLAHGGDYTFVLDVSGSMAGKIDTLNRAVGEALKTFGEDDRFRIVTFSDSARELTSGWTNATAANVATWVERVARVRVEGGTDLASGVRLGLQGLDPDRANGIFLVTDAEANQGLVDGPSFAALLATADVRIFGFLMGNSANWPLMRFLAETSGGFFSQVSNADDIEQQILLARSKVTHEALHDFKVTLDGGDTFDLSPVPGKVHAGEQVVLFGRHRGAGPVTLKIDAKITGRPVTYRHTFDLPQRATAFPELERLWALTRVEWLEYQYRLGLMDVTAGRAAVRDLGTRFQLVTDETSMILLTDADFERLGIDRTNRERTRTEAEARALRDAATTTSIADGPSMKTEDDTGGGYQGSSGGGSYSSGGDYSSSSGGGSSWGGGAVGLNELVAACLVLLAIGAQAMARRRRARVGQ